MRVAVINASDGCRLAAGRSLEVASRPGCQHNLGERHGSPGRWRCGDRGLFYILFNFLVCLVFKMFYDAKKKD